MSETISINVPIGDRNYRLRISPEDEESLRKMAKMLNQKIIEFKTEFAGKDMQDYISMVLLWYASQEKTEKGEIKIAEDSLEKIISIKTLIERTLEPKS